MTRRGAIGGRLLDAAGPAGDLLRRAARRVLHSIGAALLRKGEAALARLRAADLPAPAARALAANAALAGRHAGRRCFVLGEGRSLDGPGLRALEGELTVAAGPAVLARIPWRPTYVVSAAAEPIGARLAEGGALFVVRPYPIGDPAELLGALRPPPDKRLLCVDRGAPADGVDADALLRPLRGNWGEAELAVLLALFLGASPTVLVGFDSDWLRAPDAGALGAAAPKDAVSRYGWAMEHCLSLWSRYELLKRLARARGIEVVDTAEAGFLDCFERRRLASFGVEATAGR